MAKVSENIKLTEIAQKTIDDSSGLIDRIANYVLISLSNDAQTKSIKSIDPAEQEIRTMQGILSVINDLGGQVLYNYLDDISNELKNFPNTDKFVKEVNNALKKRLELIKDPVEVDKLKLNLAKNEASLKGFNLPLTLGGPSDELNIFKLKVDQQKKAMTATKQALMELAGTGIPRDKYAQSVVEKAAEILAKDKDVTPDSLESFKSYIAQGVKKPKQKVSEAEVAVVKNAMLRSTEELLNFIKNPDQSIIKQSIDKTLRTRFISAPKGLDAEQKKLYAEKIDKINELWGLNEDNYTNPEKIKYIGSPTPFNDSSADIVFEKTLAELIAKSSPKQIDSVVRNNYDKNPELSKQIIKILNVNASKIIIDETLKTIEDNNGYKLDQVTREKIGKQFLEKLEKLGEDYLTTRKDIIVKDLSQSLVKEKSFISYFSSKLSVSSKSLDRITHNILGNHDKLSLDHENKAIDQILIKGSLSDKQFKDNLDKFAKHNNIIIGDTYSLADARRINPKVFDEIVSGVKSEASVKSDSRQHSVQIGKKIDVKTVELSPPPSLYTPPLGMQVSKPSSASDSKTSSSLPISVTATQPKTVTNSAKAKLENLKETAITIPQNTSITKHTRPLPLTPPRKILSKTSDTAIPAIVNSNTKALSKVKEGDMLEADNISKQLQQPVKKVMRKLPPTPSIKSKNTNSVG